MGMYFKLQCKRVWKLLPRLLCALMALLLGLGLVFFSTIKSDSESENKTRVRLAVVGNAEDTYLDMGITALETLDTSRFALQVIRMEEDEARTAVEQGTIAAYVIIPDGFLEDAMRGKVHPLTVVSSDNAEGLTSMFKNEITSVISDYVLHAQKGVYGAADALRATGISEGIGDYMGRFSLRYAEVIFRRSDLYEVQELGIADSLGLGGYFFCGISVVLLMLIVLPYAPLFVRRDSSLGMVLRARRLGSFGQAAGELFALLLGLFVPVLVIALGLFGMNLVSDGGLIALLGTELSWLMVFGVIPVLVMIGALSLLLFELSRDLVSGVLLHFFLTLSLCYVSGCLYPVFAFPESVQHLSVFLPTGIARSHLAACITGEGVLLSGLMLCLYGGVFFALTVFVRRIRLQKGRG